MTEQPEVLPPHSEDAEIGVIGSVIISQGEELPELMGFLTAADFFLVKHSWIWEAILAIHERGDAIDCVPLADELNKQGRLTDIGGMAYLTYLGNNTPDSTNAQTYGHIVEQHAIRRGLLAAVTEIGASVMDGKQSIDEIVNDADWRLSRVMERQRSRSAHSLRDILAQRYAQYEAMWQDGKPRMGMPSGIPELDDLMCGFQNSTLTYVAGRPGMGKTAFMVSAAVHMANEGGRVAFFSMEMGEESIADRIVGSHLGIAPKAIALGNLNADQRAAVAGAMTWLSGLPIFIDETGTLTPKQLKAKVMTLIRQESINCVMVDYVQLMEAGSGKQNRNEEISYISRRLKLLAQDLHIPVCAAAQLNREIEGRQDKRPKPSDLRDSGSLEQDADKIIFPFRPGVYDPAIPAGDAELILAKHRNGETGTAHAFFDAPTMKYGPVKRRPVNLNNWNGGER